MAKKEYSIGEVAKLKNVSVKNLRYYDKIGVLTPAYINPENGYRYYSDEQFYRLDLIQFCLALNLPLKLFKTYLHEDQIALLPFLQRSQAQAEAQLAQAQRNLSYLQKALDDLETLSTQPIDQPFVRATPARQLYLKAYRGEYDTAHFVQSLTDFKQQFIPYGIENIFDYGLILIKRADHFQRFIYCALPQCISAPAFDLFTLPAAEVTCRINPFDMLASYADYVPDMESASTIILQKEICSAHITTSKRLFELRYWPADIG